jgi:hypothetical protein
MSDTVHAYPPYRYVAQFADGARLTFDGITEAQAIGAMDAAQSQHGCISWYNGVTDEHYESGVFYALQPQPPIFAIYVDPEEEDGGHPDDRDRPGFSGYFYGDDGFPLPDTGNPPTPND